MQPYQEASEEIQRQNQMPGKALKSLSKTAVGLAGGGAILNRVAPFLNKMIPGDIAAKGLAKIDPRFSKFINGALEKGHTMEDVRGFIQDKISPEEQPEQKQNILSQYSGELHQFIEDHINKGRAPLEAGALAQLDPKFKKAISQMEKDHKTPFSSILQALYGQGKQQGQPQSQQPAQPQQQQATQQQGQQQSGKGQEALMAILQKIQQSRGS